MIAYLSIFYYAIIVLSHCLTTDAHQEIRTPIESELTEPIAIDFIKTYSNNDINYQSTTTTLLAPIVEDTTKAPQKEYTIITYMAADNDLAPFARKNLKQQTDVGSNEKINIVTQLDTRLADNTKITRRYFIEKNKLIVTNHNDPHSQRMDSGNPETLIDCCRWAITNFPAKRYVLILWNHGTGIIDIGRPRTVNPLHLFSYNPMTQKIDLDRSMPFLSLMQGTFLDDERAICFDDTTGHYLSNQNLAYALDTICKTFLGGRKINVICFDACLMAMLEVANIVKPYAEIMVASQEVELGAGYNYELMLQPLLTQPMEPAAFGQHVVVAYEQAYNRITNDFTQSALNLSGIDALETNINILGAYLVESLQKQQGTAIRDALRASVHKLTCTHFDEPSYKDLHHMYVNLLTNLKNFRYKNEQEGRILRETISRTLQEGMSLINSIVIANAVGKNLANARGISIYMPERTIHNSYPKTTFATTNKWMSFLSFYLSLGKI